MNITFNTEFSSYQKSRIAFWNRTARSGLKSFGKYYRSRLRIIYRHLVPEGTAILEIRCFNRDLLSALKPAEGVGVDFSHEAIETACTAHPELDFVLADAHELDLAPSAFDYIIVSELVNDLWDVQTVLTRLHPYCAPHTRLIFNFYNHL